MRWEEMDKSQTPLAGLIRQFIAYSRLEGKPETTCGWYRNILRQYLAWAGESRLEHYTLERVRDRMPANPSHSA
jgi:hypothetical protein